MSFLIVSIFIPFAFHDSNHSSAANSRSYLQKKPAVCTSFVCIQQTSCLCHFSLQRLLYRLDLKSNSTGGLLTSIDATCGNLLNQAIVIVTIENFEYIKVLYHIHRFCEAPRGDMQIDNVCVYLYNNKITTK